LKTDRPREYKELVESQQLEKHLVPPLPEIVVKAVRVFGFIALATGSILIFLIIFAEIFGYR
jgi:hypothetical protein